MTAADDLAAAKQALRQAEEALQRALAEKLALADSSDTNVREHAHDIKNALGPVIGFAQILKGGDIETARQERYLDTIFQSTMRAVEICDAMLGGPNPGGTANQPDALQPVNVGAMIEEVVEQFSSMASERGVGLGAEITPEFPEINSIPQHIYRSLTNVVTNAIKFTPSGGKVAIKADIDAAENAIVLVVRDTGTGIPLEQILDIMKPGKTTVSPHGDKGTGLGLPIVNKLLTDLGGALDIDSRPGQGTTISLKFPRSMHIGGASPTE